MAVASNPLESFIWGAGGQKMSPEQVARQREMAAALMQGGMDYSPVNHWLQGAARASQGLVGGLKDRWAGEAEQAGKQGFQSQWDSVFGGGGGSPVAAALAGGSNPALSAIEGIAPTAGAPASVPTGDNAAYIRQGLTSRGLPEHIADAFLLNFQDESGLNPGINEAAPVVPGSRGGYGLYQLTGPRRRAYEAFAAERGIPVDSIDGQLDFLMGELAGSESAAAKKILSSADTPSAAAAIVNSFLRPAEVHRARREAAYLGGAGGAAQVGGMGGAPQGSTPSVAQLLALSGNEWANPGQSNVINALLNQGLQQQDPAYQQQMAMRDLQMQQEQLKLQQMLNPQAPAPVFEGGQWWDLAGGQPNALTDRAVDPTSGMQNFSFLTGQGFDPQDAAGRAFSGGVTVNNIPQAGAPATGYQNIFNDQGQLVRQEMVEGGPAWNEAQAAQAAATSQEGAQLRSDIEGAATTLASTQSVLDLLDNSGGQPVTGTFSKPFAALSNTPAGQVRSYVSTLQSGVALGAMQRLKEASATGATGFGALSAPELNLLISDIGALDPDNTESPIFRKTVERIQDRSKRVVADIRRNVSPERIAELGLTEFINAIDPQGGAGAVIDYSSETPPAEWGGDPNLWRFMSPEDRALW